MIFVTVGTHEQPFNRLIEYIDKLVGSNVLNEEVIIQTGFSTYEPKYCQWKKLYSYQQMTALTSKARIIITHGGPSSFIMPLQIGKIPIVIPRQKKYGEHVNDHQLHFVTEVAKRMGNIIAVINVEKLLDTINYYDEIIKDMNNRNVCNNQKYCDDFEKIVNEMQQIKV